MGFILQDLLPALYFFLILKNPLSVHVCDCMHLFLFHQNFPYRKRFKVAFKSLLADCSGVRSQQKQASSSDLQAGSLAGQASGEGFVIWKCLRVRLTACGGCLLSLQGLNMILSKPDNPGKTSQGLWLLPSKLLTPVLKGTVMGIQYVLWSGRPWKNRVSPYCLPLSSKHSFKIADRPTRQLGDVFELRQLLQMLKNWQLNFH